MKITTEQARLLGECFACGTEIAPERTRELFRGLTAGEVPILRCGDCAAAGDVGGDAETLSLCPARPVGVRK